MNQYLKMDADQLNRDIDTLLLEYPDLAGDENLRADMLEGETDLHGVIAKALEISQRANETVIGIAARQKELADRKARYGRRKDAMRGLVFKIMQRADLNKIELQQATLSIRAGVQKVEYTGDDLPDDMTIIKRVPDARKIKEALVNGAQVSGAVLSNGQSTLSVRVK